MQLPLTKTSAKSKSVIKRTRENDVRYLAPSQQLHLQVTIKTQDFMYRFRSNCKQTNQTKPNQDQTQKEANYV